MPEPDPNGPPNQVVVRADPAPPQPSPPANVTILPVQPIHGHQPADDGRLAALEAKFEAGMSELRSTIASAVRQPAPAAAPPEPEPVVAVAPPPPPPEPPDPNAAAEPTGPRKRGFLERFLHSGCPD